MAKKHDVVYPLSMFVQDDLRYSLRSMEKNLSYRNVFIVGGRPKWIQNVTHIISGQTKSKYANANGNITKACHWDVLSDDFILMNDDFYIMQPVTTPKVYNMGYMLDVLNKWPVARGKYWHILFDTYRTLKMEGIKKPLFYEFHTPTLFNKKLRLEVQDKFWNPQKPLATRSLYYNYFGIEGEYRKQDVKCRFPGDVIQEDDFASSSDDYLKDKGFRKIKVMFKDKSKYEM